MKEIDLTVQVKIFKETPPWFFFFLILHKNDKSWLLNDLCLTYYRYSHVYWKVSIVFLGKDVEIKG